MSEDREIEGQTTESTERIPPGSMSPKDAGSDADDPNRKADEKADEESKDSFPASDPPSW